LPKWSSPPTTAIGLIIIISKFNTFNIHILFGIGSETQVPIEMNSVKETSDSKISPGLKMALELGPVAIFVLAYNRGAWLISVLDLPELLQRPIFLATAIFMAVMVIALTISWFLTRSLPVMPVVTLVVVLVFGALTLYFQNDTFIKMKPTIINLLFGGALLGGLAFGKTLIRIVMGAAFKLDDDGWWKLTFRWGLFFIFLAAVNEAVWRNSSESFWVGFKLWGMTSLSFAFILSQMPMIMRHTIEEDEEASDG